MIYFERIEVVNKLEPYSGKEQSIDQVYIYSLKIHHGL